jgi:hypothetical protein
VAGLNAGRSYGGDIADSDIAEMLARGFHATGEEARTGAPDTM